MKQLTTVYDPQHHRHHTTFSVLLLSLYLFTFLTHPWPTASYWSVLKTEKYLTATAADLGFSWGRFFREWFLQTLPHIFAPSTSEGCSLHCSTTTWPVIRSLEETHDPVQLCNVFLISFWTSADLLVLVVFSFVTWVYLKSPCSSPEKDRYKPGPVDSPGSGRFPVCPSWLLNLRDGDVWQCNGQCVFHAALQCTCHFHNMVTVFALDKQFL